jgi:hypothetical protein
MSSHTPSKIIGYYDSDGFAYCIKHARDKSESIPNNVKDENCCICGAALDDIKSSQ